MADELEEMDTSKIKVLFGQLTTPYQTKINGQNTEKAE